VRWRATEPQPDGPRDPDWPLRRRASRSTNTPALKPRDSPFLTRTRRKGLSQGGLRRRRLDDASGRDCLDRRAPAAIAYTRATSSGHTPHGGSTNSTRRGPERQST
jgi:hypothetical protein